MPPIHYFLENFIILIISFSFFFKGTTKASYPMNPHMFVHPCILSSLAVWSKSRAYYASVLFLHEKARLHPKLGCEFSKHPPPEAESSSANSRSRRNSAAATTECAPTRPIATTRTAVCTATNMSDRPCVCGRCNGSVGRRSM